jgi:dipeptidase D
MSAEIENLVETSLNLGVLLTKNDEIKLHFTLRSNKKSGLIYLEEKLSTLFSKTDGYHTVSGHYPPWEYKDNSELQKTFLKVYNEFYGKKPKVEAIHAGLECGVFSTGIKDLDCIAIGPQLFDVHTTNERLSVASTKNTYELLIKLLEDI